MRKINIVDLPLNSDKSSSILYLLSLSKAPVGSSAKLLEVLLIVT